MVVICAVHVLGIATNVYSKKALSNYHGGSDMPLSLMIADCPEYIRTENRHARISWYDFNEVVPRSDSDCVTLNPNTTVRFNVGVTDSGT